MIRLNGEKMRQRLADILVVTGEEKGRTVNGKNGEENKWNGTGSQASFKDRSY